MRRNGRRDGGRPNPHKWRVIPSVTWPGLWFVTAPSRFWWLDEQYRSREEAFAYVDRCLEHQAMGDLATVSRYVLREAA